MSLKRFSRTAVAVVAAAPLLMASTAALASAPGQQKPGNYSFAVIGDVPYGQAQIDAFPGWVDQINADRDVSMTIHVGDIKNGSSACTNEYFANIRTQFDRFEQPLIYVPGDNEWTDCHRLNNGAYNPYERLDMLRTTFFPKPGQTLGEHSTKVASQVKLGFPENVQLRRQGVSMAVVHVVGSNNGLAPWTGATTANAQQVTEEKARMDASIALIKDTFAQAAQRNDRAVAIYLQADMFDPTYTPKPSDISAFTPLVQTLIDESNAFQGQVYLFDGDSHVYNVDQPLQAGSVWLSRYGVSGSTSNLTRITVDGSSNNHDWLKVTVNRPGAESVLSWEQVPYTS
ncbi:metallophosphoesterase [Kribbia dieselivorans]|uniref:metallophosphoesterase n=1 Tax=Kribbia dieselivorans TaxID=331526 RepID=UPI000838793D|nr:metallophosphoesterase [Kribbia dieselivorans]